MFPIIEMYTSEFSRFLSINTKLHNFYKKEIIEIIYIKFCISGEIFRIYISFSILQLKPKK